MQKISALLLVGLAVGCTHIHAFHLSQTEHLRGLIRTSLSMKSSSEMKKAGMALNPVDRRSAVADFVKFASFCFVFGPSIPAYAKRARGGSDINKDTVPETREEREARIKKERAEYEERRKQAEVKLFRQCSTSIFPLVCISCLLFAPSISRLMCHTGKRARADGRKRKS